MSFDQAIRSAFKNYADFNGRACRSEYWYLVLFYALMSALTLTPLWPLGLVLGLAVMLPLLAAACRRLHDTGRSGWYLLVGLAPAVGPIILLIWLCEPGQPGSNQYGAAPGAPMHAAAPAVQAGSWKLAGLAGPARGLIYALPPNRASNIGRSSTCVVCVGDTAGVSRIHCALRPYAGGVELTDLGSTYGTFLADGKQLPPNFPATLRDGDRFYLGSPNVMFRLERG